MAAQSNESAAITARAVQVPRSLKHSFSNRVGLPPAGEKVRVPPAFARVLSTWLATGTVLVVPAHSGSATSSQFAAWLKTRAERILWLDGADLQEEGDAVDATLDGLYELGIITLIERATSTHLVDADEALKKESTPILVVVENTQLIVDLPTFTNVAGLVSRWPNFRWAFVTNAPVKEDLGSTAAITLVRDADLQEPLAATAFTTSGAPVAASDLVRNWAQHRDASGDLYRVILLLSRHLSVSRDSADFSEVDAPDAAIDQLRESRVIRVIETQFGERISLVPEFRYALDMLEHAPISTEIIEFHTDAARRAVLVGDDDSTIFHLARAGHHGEALAALAAIPVIVLSAPSRIEGIRHAAAAIDIADPRHSIFALATRLQIAVVPPLETKQVRDEIQEALQRAEARNGEPLSAELAMTVNLAHVAGLIARGQYREARLLGKELAEFLRARSWLELGRFGILPTLAWTGQATAELLDGNIDEASIFGSLAQDSAMTGAMPYSLYLATSALAAIEAKRGELVVADLHLLEAQRIYRSHAWPRSVAQTAEFVARFYLAEAALDVDGMTDLHLDISVIPDLSASLMVLMKCCECFVYLHSGQATQSRVAVRQLGSLLRDSGPGALFQAIGAEMTFEAILRSGEADRAAVFLRSTASRGPDGDCLIPLLAAANVTLNDGVGVIEATDGCIGLGSHHSSAGQSLLLLIRAAAHQLAGDTVAADETFHEALLTQQPAPMPYLFLMVPTKIRTTLWSRVPPQRKSEWVELRRFLATVPETVIEADEALPRTRLTPREMEILTVLSLGGTLEEIAATQFVSRNTVKSHVRTIYQKLHVGTRAQATEIMKRFGQQLLENPAVDEREAREG